MKHQMPAAAHHRLEDETTHPEIVWHTAVARDVSGSRQYAIPNGCVGVTQDAAVCGADDAAMSQSEALRRAREEAMRRHRLRMTARPETAVIVAARPTGALDGMAALVEFDLELTGTGDDPRRRVTVVEPVPLVLAGRALVGMSVDVFVADGGVLIEWSA
jgi:hypothetical protein